MLRRDSDSTTVSEEDPSLDCHNEAQQYEEKLIQVADMHAELMEFNARLILQLNERYQLFCNLLFITLLLCINVSKITEVD